MGEVARSSEIIAAEINFYKEQTAVGIMEIGKRLIEAQDMLGDGENFTAWLKEKVDFSRSTAYNFIRVAKEFNDVQALGRLGQTKVFQLLEIPEGEREGFINSTHKVNGKEKTVDEMSTRELQKAIKERDEALKKLENAKNAAAQKAEEARRLLEEKQKAEHEKRTKETLLKEKQNDIKMLQAEIAKLEERSKKAEKSGNSEEVKSLKSELKSLGDEVTKLNKENERLQQQLKEGPIEVQAVKEVVIEKVPEEIEKELAELREKARELESKAGSQDNSAMLKYAVYFEELVKKFKDILGTLAEIKENDEGAHEKYTSALKGLINKMLERL